MFYAIIKMSKSTFTEVKPVKWHIIKIKAKTEQAAHKKAVTYANNKILGSCMDIQIYELMPYTYNYQKNIIIPKMNRESKVQIRKLKDGEHTTFFNNGAA